MVIWVVEFSKEGYKIRNIFGQKSISLKEIIVSCELTVASHQKLGIIFRKFWVEYIFIPPFGVFLQKIGVDFASEVGHIALHGSIQIAFPYLTFQYGNTGCGVFKRGVQN